MAIPPRQTALTPLPVGSPYNKCPAVGTSRVTVSKRVMFMAGMAEPCYCLSRGLLIAGSPYFSVTKD